MQNLGDTHDTAFAAPVSQTGWVGTGSSTQTPRVRRAITSPNEVASLPTATHDCAEMHETPSSVGPAAASAGLVGSILQPVAPDTPTAALVMGSVVVPAAVVLFCSTVVAVAVTVRVDPPQAAMIIAIAIATPTAAIPRFTVRICADLENDSTGSVSVQPTRYSTRFVAGIRLNVPYIPATAPLRSNLDSAWS
jgi:hypothetical protein